MVNTNHRMRFFTNMEIEHDYTPMVCQLDDLYAVPSIYPIIYHGNTPVAFVQSPQYTCLHASFAHTCPAEEKKLKIEGRLKVLHKWHFQPRYVIGVMSEDILVRADGFAVYGDGGGVYILCRIR
jgi:hypothetical protein